MKAERRKIRIFFLEGEGHVYKEMVHQAERAKIIYTNDDGLTEKNWK